MPYFPIHYGHFPFISFKVAITSALKSLLIASTVLYWYPPLLIVFSLEKMWYMVLFIHIKLIWIIVETIFCLVYIRCLIVVFLKECQFSCGGCFSLPLWMIQTANSIFGLQHRFQFSCFIFGWAACSLPSKYAIQGFTRSWTVSKHELCGSLSLVLSFLGFSCHCPTVVVSPPILSSGLSGQKDCEFSIRVLALEVSSPRWSLPSGSRL